MSGHSILLIEDGDDQRTLLASLLAELGFEVRACSMRSKRSSSSPAGPRRPSCWTGTCRTSDVLTGAISLDTRGSDARLLERAEILSAARQTWLKVLHPQGLLPA